MNITKNQLACLRKIAPNLNHEKMLLWFLSLIDSVAAEKGWDISEIEPDPETVAQSLKDYENGNYLTTEQYIEEIRKRKSET